MSFSPINSTGTSLCRMVCSGEFKLGHPTTKFMELLSKLIICVTKVTFTRSSLISIRSINSGPSLSIRIMKFVSKICLSQEILLSKQGGNN